MRFLLQLVLILMSIQALTQNKVLNPSFEIFDDCPSDMTLYPQRKLIPNWYMPNRGTSDYFNACTRIMVSVPENFIGNLWAYDGQAYSGIVLLEIHPNDSIEGIIRDYREYIQGELDSPLLGDKKYLISIHYAIATYSTFAVNRLGVCISEKRISNRFTYKTLDCKPIISIDENHIDTERNVWYELRDTIMAKGGEKYITIGNFHSDNVTQYVRLDCSDFNIPLQEKIRTNGLAYYYIDMINIKEILD